MVDTILAQTAELKRAPPKMQIKGRQIVLLIRRFFEVKKDRRIQYELTNLLDLTYPGDARMTQVKLAWDIMLRNVTSSFMIHEQNT